MRTWLHIKHHLHGLPPKRNHRVEASEIEVVFDEILMNFTEVLMSRQ